MFWLLSISMFWVLSLFSSSSLNVRLIKLIPYVEANNLRHRPYIYIQCFAQKWQTIVKVSLKSAYPSKCETLNQPRCDIGPSSATIAINTRSTHLLFFWVVPAGVCPVVYVYYLAYRHWAVKTLTESLQGPLYTWLRLLEQLPGRTVARFLPFWTSSVWNPSTAHFFSFLFPGGGVFSLKVVFFWFSIWSGPVLFQTRSPVVLRLWETRSNQRRFTVGPMLETLVQQWARGVRTERRLESMLGECWSSVCDAGPAFTQYDPKSRLCSGCVGLRYPYLFIHPVSGVCLPA